MDNCGESLTADLDEDAIRARHDRKLRRRVVRYFLPHWRRGLIVLILITAGAILGLVPALVTK